MFWIVLLLVGPAVFFLFIMPIISNREAPEVKENRISSLNQEIESTYRLFFGESTKSQTEKIREIQRAVIKMKEEENQRYLKENEIIKTSESFSSLGYCGVSKTHLYTNIHNYFHNTNGDPFVDRFLPDLVQQYEEECSHNIEQYASGMKSMLGLYRMFKASGVDKIFGKKLALDDILYFKIDGSVHHLSNVHGGGVNLQGAVAGAIIGGGAAAIIGSQVGTETTTDIVTKDDRKIRLFVKGSNGITTVDIESNKPEKTIAALRELMPSKEEAVVQANSRPSTDSVAAASSADELKKFKELLDAGVITQEEFDTKKKQLLGL